MPEMTLVTISWNEYERDFELPSSRSFSQWEESLRSALRQAFPGILLSDRKIRLYCKGICIQENETLKQWGIWDGSRLKLVVE